ncbi:PREDICTED: ubiquitin-like protein 4A-B [Priapulus caudatus]|uniref:Ubiquitin-like protein 4A-B n=1 Tax=Priapulus caudatus TaxID=37621 RepID=A0ABM1ES37_PRICU|nr:PREDICTED: ubiquitin-like protein 4A-B [Priapulus caudatus]
MAVNLTVKVLQGGECTLMMSPDDSIQAVKEKVAIELSVPIQQQRLVLRGKTLSDSQTLESYKIGSGAKLHLVILKNATPDGSTAPAHKSDALWIELSTVLNKHFSADDAKRVLDELRKDFDYNLRIMSLDDVERLARHGLRLQPDGDACDA